MQTPQAGWLLSEIPSVWWYFLVCTCRLDRVPNRLPQWLQGYGFITIWTLRCLLTVDFCENRLPQISQLNGFSPVWTLVCIFSLSLSGKRFWQLESQLKNINQDRLINLTHWLTMCRRTASHWCGFSSVCKATTWYWILYHRGHKLVAL